MSAPVERTFLPRGLIAYWKMDDVTGAARINEITPGTLNFTQTGGVVQAAVTGKAFVYASEIEGSTMSLAITANTAVNLGSVFSHAGWYMVSDKTKSNYLLDYGDDATFGDIGSLLIEGNAGGGAVRAAGEDVTGTPQIVQTSFGLLQNSVWHHIAVTCDGITMTVYIDGGSVVLRVTQLGGPAAGACTIELAPGVSGQNLWVAQLGLWNRCLGAAEVAALYNGGQGLAAAPT